GDGDGDRPGGPRAEGPRGGARGPPPPVGPRRGGPGGGLGPAPRAPRPPPPRGACGAATRSSTTCGGWTTRPRATWSTATCATCGPSCGTTGGGPPRPPPAPPRGSRLRPRD